MQKVKFAFIALSLLTYLIVTRLISFALVFAKPRFRRNALNRTTLTLCRAMRFVGGIKLHVSGNTELLKERGLFFIANHVGYLDGIVMGSLVPGSFIAKVEILEMAYINKVVSASDAIFIDSRKRSEIVIYNADMTQRLQENINILIFPEGHCTDGTKVLPFYSAYFDAPLKARANIVPINIEYESLDGESIKNRDELSFYETMSFFPHLLNLLRYKRIDVSVRVHDQVDITPYASNAKDRKFVANYCQDILAAHKNKIYEVLSPKVDAPVEIKSFEKETIKD